MKNAMVIAALGAVACGGKHAQPPPSSVSDAPAPVPIELRLEGVLWTIATDGAQVAPSDTGVTVTTPTFTLTIQSWPDSDMFVRTSGEHLASLRESDPATEAVHEVDGGVGRFQVVARTEGHLDGTVLVPDGGGGDDAMCDFELAADADWHPALAACLSLRQSTDPAPMDLDIAP